MQLSFIREWWVAFYQELRNHWLAVAVGFVFATIAVAVVGWFWPLKYEASAILFADSQNIITPLLEGSAEVTRFDVDQVSAVRERALSRQILEDVVLDAGLVSSRSPQAVEDAIQSVRGAVDIENLGRSYIEISYRAHSPQKAYEVTSAVVQAFIEDIVRSKRAESKEAFSFIDRQVKSYQEQLQDAEEALKQFKSQNTDGTEGEVNKRISSLRAKIEELKIDREEASTRHDELKQQLARESEFLNRRYKADVYRERLNLARSRLDDLRLSYEDTYPDIVSLKQQIEDMEQAIRDTQNEPADGSRSGSAAVNPVYEQLRAQLAEAAITLRTLDMRAESTRELLEREHNRSQRIAEYQAELSELTRDYDVTKSIYEDMLERKEKARLSMTLDIEGQGVSYKVQEPPRFPSEPVGLRFVHFYLAAPWIGMLVPMALILAYILLDPRIRFASRLEHALPESVPVLAVIPEVQSAADRRANRARMLALFFVFAAVITVYAVIAVFRLTGMI